MLGNYFEMRIDNPRVFGTSNGKMVDYIHAFGSSVTPKLNLKPEEAGVKMSEQYHFVIETNMETHRAKINL